MHIGDGAENTPFRWGQYFTMQWIASDTWYADLLVMEHKNKIQHSLPYLNKKMLQVFENLPVASFNKEVNPQMA